MSTRFNGVVIGVVCGLDDPEGQGRILVRYPWLGSDEESHWAPVAAPMAGGDRGVYFMPEEGDEVLLAFHHGDFAHPCVIGYMWNGVHAPPSEDVRQRMIRSKNGHMIRFVDSTEADGDRGALIIEDAHGNTISLHSAGITIKAVGVLNLDAPQIILGGAGYSRSVVQTSRPV